MKIRGRIQRIQRRKEMKKEKVLETGGKKLKQKPKLKPKPKKK